MKALTLTQPWASLVASGAKRWETRSWRTHYRGPLAIHAAAGFPPAPRALCSVEPFRFRLRAEFSCGERELRTPEALLPLGRVIAVTWVEDVVPTSDVRGDLGEEELAFGDYSDGRYAWKLREPVTFAPVACTGHLGLWTVSEMLIPESARRAIETPGRVRLMDSTERKVRGIVYREAAYAYGYKPRHSDDPEQPCRECEHALGDHTGEEWDGPCGVHGCACQRFAERAT